MTTAAEHFSNATAEYERFLEEGREPTAAYTSALDYLEDFAPSPAIFSEALALFVDAHGLF